MKPCHSLQSREGKRATERERVRAFITSWGFTGDTHTHAHAHRHTHTHTTEGWFQHREMCWPALSRSQGQQNTKYKRSSLSWVLSPHCSHMFKQYACLLPCVGLWLCHRREQNTQCFFNFLFPSRLILLTLIISFFVFLISQSLDSCLNYASSALWNLIPDVTVTEA